MSNHNVGRWMTIIDKISVCLSPEVKGEKEKVKKIYDNFFLAGPAYHYFLRAIFCGQEINENTLCKKYLFFFFPRREKQAFKQTFFPSGCCQGRVGARAFTTQTNSQNPHGPGFLG
jgi:hypothetical protein